MIIDVEKFVHIKSYKAKGKRITTYTIDKITELEPARLPDPTPETKPIEKDYVDEDPDGGKSEADIIDEITGQMKLF